MKEELILNSNVTRSQWRAILEKFFRITKDNNEKTKNKDTKSTNSGI